MKISQSPANVAAAIAKLSGKANFIGKVGQDAFGDHLEQVLWKAVSSLDGEQDFMFYRNQG
ncbi:PfkB family carbohydrate kinase [Cohnella sp.]|uniref:PfkB family carbohydrate kinase n=1 Tax=Cohnella sp. TaxID=1883426 RepID=UPI003566B746